MNDHEPLSAAKIDALLLEYQTRFPEQAGNDWVLHPQLLGNIESLRKLVAMLREALQTGVPLTQKQIDEKIEPVSWEE